MSREAENATELVESEPPSAGGSFSYKGQTFLLQPCATEWGTCNLSGPSKIAFGVNGVYSVKSLPAGPASCTTAVFGDPKYGIAKSCYISADSPALASSSLASPPKVADPAPTAVPYSPALINASRFLTQATFGPNRKEIEAVANSTPEAWINQQFSIPPMDSHWDYAVIRKGPKNCNPCDAEWVNAVMESFWLQAVQGPDQLRQRLVFALSQLFVISTVNSSIETAKEAHAAYLDMLSSNAFGNFRTLLEQVALHPAMGHYLSHIRNLKEDPSTGRLPDENFAREIMQLFTVGLWQLNPDGTRKKDASGNSIPTYSQADVMGMAKVFTGWSWGNGDWMAGFIKPAPSYNRVLRAWNQPMRNYAQYHSKSEKRILGGVVIPANTSGEQSLKVALDTLFNHPNVGPFIGTHLIKRFVTSNPSPAYVARVTAAFNNNGQGVRGDMKAVIKAVLLDPEARDNGKLADPNWGKLREPMIRYANYMRAFDVKAKSGKYKIWNLEDSVRSIGQNPLRAPSVFNWYQSNYAPPGDVMVAGLVAPEFQITHETTATGYANFIVRVAEGQSNWYRDNVASKLSAPITDWLAGDYSAEMALASNPAALVERLNLILAAGRLRPATKDIIISAVSSIPATASAGHSRVAAAVALTMTSPDFIVQK